MIKPLFEHTHRECGGWHYLTPHPQVTMRDLAAFMREARDHGELWSIEQDLLPDVVLSMRSRVVPMFLKAQGE